MWDGGVALQWLLARVQWNLSKTAACGPVLTDLYREVAALQRYIDCNALVLFGARKAGCFREVAV